MAGRGQKRQLTEDEWRFCREMFAKNQSKTKIADGLGINRRTFNRIISEEPDFLAEIERIKNDRMKKVREKAQDAVELLLTKHEYYETKTKSEPRPRVLMAPRMVDGEQMKDRKGKPIYDETPVLDAMGQQIYDMVVVEKTRTRKTILPNASVTMWAACNTMADKYKPMNKAEVNIENKPNHNFEITWAKTPGSKEAAK